MSKMFQIREIDLVTIEAMIPEILGAMMSAGSLDNRARIKFRVLKGILSDVRWNYGPPTEVEIEECG